ncbi:sensor histidine kinase [Paenibacillus sp. BSR1-1]|uniref:cache domain-containing sensor histidine kinase n=1 Tax=Paenibacillus sp. BSR1-1 TaxID=3020845 RepID=UPI0025AFA04F|nr:sensor histidine kinase [Paenibacillus sp. BSR1-1]MDN3019094.1 sensor histidine kinase [Paenibacillus sp. BSR1-1]
MRFIRFPKFRHLKNQLLFQHALGITFIIGLTAIVTYTIAIQIQIKDAVRYNTIMVTQISKSIDNMVDSFNRVMDGVSFNNDVQSLLQSKYENDKEKNLLNRYLSSNVTDETMMFNEVDLIYLYDMESLRVNLRRSVNNNDYPFFKTLRPELYDDSGKVTWSSEQSVITANRVIYDINSYKMKKIGYLTMSMDKSYLQERIQKFDPTEERHLIILDRQNNVVLSNSNDEELKRVTSWLSNSKNISTDEDSFIEIPKYGKMLVSTFKSNLTGWKIISLVSLDEISEGPALIGKSVFLIGILAIIIGNIFIWISTNYFVKPLNKLSLVMDEVEKDNFNAQVEIDRVDELGRVGESFNRMMNKINTLISDIYQKDINEKDAQLRALRAQINPHFLYNTLDAINWMAQFGKTDEVSKMTVSLSRLLKTSIKNNQEFIRLEEEMNYIEDYMTIQKIRFQDKIHFSINIAPEANDCLVPKLILQPIVENAMIHGLEKKIDHGYLFINGNIKGNKLHIQVIDNGVGMDEHTIHALSEGSYVQLDEKQGTGNGVLNVQNRIRLLFGEENGLKIESNINVGTLFELILPVQREGFRNV